MTTFDDNTLERQLSSLFRAEAEQAHLPQGTWQAISPRMGEPDAVRVFRKLTDAISFPRWRNPMKVRYAAPAATIVLAAIAALLFILLVNNDADSNSSPVPAASPTVPVGPTEQVPTPDLEATVQAANDSATATALAQPTAVPTATPNVDARQKVCGAPIAAWRWFRH